MGSLPTTKYPNNIRTVSGTVSVEVDDVTLECDTSLGPVVINLLTIPSGDWSTQYKLYVFDSGNKAGTNNITIVAPAGQKINNAPQVVISSNGAGGYTRVGDNINYIWSNTVTSPVDTGWLDLLGFSWVDPTKAPQKSTIRPQYRVIGNQIVLRRQIIVPLQDGSSNLIPYTVTAGIANYEGQAFVTPFNGVDPTYGPGVLVNAGGSITFRLGAPVFQSAAHFPGESYATAITIGLRRVYTDQGQGNETLLTSPAILIITTTGQMVIQTLYDLETGVNAGANGLGASLLRYLTSNIITGQYTSDYTKVSNLAATVGGLQSNPTAAPLQFEVPNSSDSAKHVLTLDAAIPAQIGGFQWNIGLLIGYTN